ncbi:MAG: hypothetical protein NTY48_03285 [Candidatus Diapherotrites archaeon]|nr:hypothetical protein [Candidatus Diapherotrites archaeon]
MANPGVRKKLQIKRLFNYSKNTHKLLERARKCNRKISEKSVNYNPSDFNKSATEHIFTARIGKKTRVIKIGKYERAARENMNRLLFAHRSALKKGVIKGSKYELDCTPLYLHADKNVSVQRVKKGVRLDLLEDFILYNLNDNSLWNREIVLFLKKYPKVDFEKLGSAYDELCRDFSKIFDMQKKNPPDFRLDLVRSNIFVQEVNPKNGKIIFSLIDQLHYALAKKLSENYGMKDSIKQ